MGFSLLLLLLGPHATLGCCNSPQTTIWVSENGAVTKRTCAWVGNNEQEACRSIDSMANMKIKNICERECLVKCKRTSLSYRWKKRRKCNGLVSNCDKRVNELMYATLHNAGATIQDGVSLFPNHECGIEAALEAGFRGINIDLGKCDGKLALKHTFCWLGTRDPLQLFANISSFLDKYPNEVLIIPIQVESDTVTLQEIYDMLSEAGVVDRLYTHTSGQAWPTLNHLIDQKRNILLFHYNGPYCSGSSCPLGLMSWFEHAVESRFSFETIQQAKDYDYACEITRGDADTAAFYGINVFLELPSLSAAQILNQEANLKAHIDACQAKYPNRPVNLVLIDYWSVGAGWKVVDDYNRAL